MIPASHYFHDDLLNKWGHNAASKIQPKSDIWNKNKHVECKTGHCITLKNYILSLKKSKKDKIGVWDTAQKGFELLLVLNAQKRDLMLQGKFPIWLQALTNIGIVPAGTSAALPSLRASWKAITPTVKRLCDLCLYSCKYLLIIVIERLPKHNGLMTPTYFQLSPSVVVCQY